MTKSLFGWIFAAVVLIGAADWWAEARMEAMVRKQVGQSLQAILTSTTKAMDIWLDERLADTRSISRSSALAHLVVAHQSAQKDKNRRFVAEKISAYLNPLLTKHGYAGYALLDRNASMVAANFPISDALNTKEGKTYLERVLNGESLSASPVKIHLPANSGDGKVTSRYLLTLHPIQNADNTVSAVFIVAIDLYESLTQITSLAGFEQTGETYAFDAEGVMATSSRFENHLRQAGLLLTEQSSVGHVSVRDPGGDLTQGFEPALPRKEQPFTFMAQEALAGRKGINVDGYRDYRGVTVVGAWTWDEKLKLGIATEIDQSEVYQVVSSLRLFSSSVLALTVIAAVALLLLMWKNNKESKTLNQALEDLLVRKEEEEKQRFIAEKKLKNSEESLLKAQAVAHLGNWSWNLASETMEWSEEVFNLFGLESSPEVPSYERFIQVVYSEDRSFVADRLQQVEKAGDNDEFICRIIRPDGTVRWMEVKVQVDESSQERAESITGTIQDIDRRKRAEDSLLEYRNLIEGSSQQYAVFDRDLRYRLANQQYLRARNLESAEQVIGCRLNEAIGENVYNGDVENCLEAAFGGEIQTIEIQVTLPDLGKRQWAILFMPIRRTHSHVDRVAVEIIDITDKKQAEKALTESEKRYRSVVEDNPVFIRSVLPDGNIAFANKAYCQYMGKSLEDLTEEPLNMFLQETDRDALWTLLHGLSPQQPVATHEHLERAEGDRFQWHRWTYRAVFSEAGDLQSYLSFGEDITATHEAQEELARYRENLEQSIAQRTAELTEANRILEDEVQERKMAEEQIRLSESRLDAMIKTAADGIITTDKEGHIFSFNPAAETIFGYDAQDVIGAHLDRLIPESTSCLYEALSLQPQNNEGESVGHITEVLGRRQDGSDVALEVSLSEFCGNGTLMFTGIVHDISKRKQIENSLKQAKSAAEAASLAKSRFLANMSHEIRTPMNSVIGYVDLTLEEPTLSSHVRRNMKIASRSARSLLRLINDILDISKMEAGKLDLEEARFNIFTLLDDVVSSFASEVRDRGLALTVKPDKQLSQCYLGDYTRLRQVLVNLVGNAVKFTPEGSIQISVQPQVEKNRLLFSVADTGIGIAHDKIETILEPFTQEDSSMTRRFGGTGLGTTISRQIIEAMGGEIWLESQSGQGTTFYFTVALTEPECAASCSILCKDHHMEEQRAESAVKRSFRILLAEDIEENAVLAEARLKNAGHRTVHVWDGEQAVEAWQEEAFDLILMDVQMPNMDGLTATSRIRELEAEAESRIPIFALTASVMREEKERCLAAGMDQVIGKPVDFYTLFAKIEEAIPQGVGRPVGDDEKEGKLSQDLPSNLPGLDLDNGLERWQDFHTYRKALKVFAASHADSVVDISNLVKEEAFEEAYHKAHALKGLAGNLAMSEVYDLAVQLDDLLKSARTDQVEELLSLLNDAMAVVVQGIRSLPDENETTAATRQDMDVGHVAGLLEELIEALEQDTPEASEALIEQLKGYLGRDRLGPIVTAIEQFDFERAQKTVASLMELLEEGENV